MSGQPVSIMVEGVQVTLPSYEEAVSGNGVSASTLSSESRVQIVLSEGQHATAPEAGPSRPSSLKQQHSEMAVVHPGTQSSSSSSPAPSSSTWALEHAGAAAPTSSQRRPSAGSDQHSLTLMDSEMDYSDGKALCTLISYISCLMSLFCFNAHICLFSTDMPLLKEAWNMVQSLNLTGITSAIADPYWWGMPPESLSTQLSTQTSPTKEAPSEAVGHSG